MLPNTFHRIALAFTLALCSAALAAKQSATLPSNGARKPAPDFTLTDATGAPLQLSVLKGKVVVLDFWATWCHGCKIEIPWYMEFQKKYKSQGLVVIGVSMDEDGWKSVEPYLAKHPINYPIAIGDSELAKRYNVEALPVTLLIDRDGNIAATHAGMVHKSSFERQILSLLQDGAKISAK